MGAPHGQAKAPVKKASVAQRADVAISRSVGLRRSIRQSAVTYSVETNGRFLKVERRLWVDGCPTNAIGRQPSALTAAYIRSARRAGTDSRFVSIRLPQAL